VASFGAIDPRVNRVGFVWSTARVFGFVRRNWVLTSMSLASFGQEGTPRLNWVRSAQLPLPRSRPGATCKKTETEMSKNAEEIIVSRPLGVLMISRNQQSQRNGS
jgi:hypothetical protein